ncbi:flagellar motor switch protein FliG [Breznakiellaceae bacterium SP9]
MAKAQGSDTGHIGLGSRFFKSGKDKNGSARDRAEFAGFWDNLDEADIPETTPSGKFLKTTGSDTIKEQKYRKVAKFLILIGSEEASKILAQLEPSQIEAITKQIADIRSISQEESEQILQEFRLILATSYGLGGLSQGGIEAARKLLYEAFGPQKGEQLLHNSVPSSKVNPFSFLEDYSGEQLSFLLLDESPAVCALILARLSPELSAAVLAKIPPDRKLEIVLRIAKQGQTGPEVLQRVAAALHEKIKAAAGTGFESTEIDGVNTLAAILKHSDISFGDKILGQLEDHDPELSKNLKERLYTLDDVVNAEDRPLQEKLRNMPDRDLVLLLKGRSDEFTQKILSNLSSNRRTRVMEETALMGKVPKKDADVVAHSFLAWFRAAREEGKIIMLNSEDIIV